MVTALQIAKLDSRIEALAAALGHGPGPAKYVVRFRFDGESDDEFYGRYPDARRDGRAIVLDFGDATQW
jgi:hypothetical protein